MLLACIQLNREQYRAAMLEETRTYHCNCKEWQHEENVIGEAQESKDRKDMQRFLWKCQSIRLREYLPCNHGLEGRQVIDVIQLRRVLYTHLLDGKYEGVPRNRIDIVDDGHADELSILDEIEKAAN